jgi:hypothetical protein
VLCPISCGYDNVLADGHGVDGYARGDIAQTNDCGFHGFTSFQVWFVRQECRTFHCRSDKVVLSLDLQNAFSETKCFGGFYFQLGVLGPGYGTEP